MRNSKGVFFLCLFLFLVKHSFGNSGLSVSGLVVDNRTLPIGLDNPRPRFSWKIFSLERNTMQQTYEIRVYIMDGVKKKLFWNSGIVRSGQSNHVVYTGHKLQPRTRYYWQVQIKDNHENIAKWSDLQYWETGLQDTSQWQAEWIEAGRITNGNVSAPPVFSRVFDIPSKIVKARLYITAHGIYDARINGRSVTDYLFTPGWTSYSKRLQYQVYDVTHLIRKGRNSTFVTIGDGWYSGYLQEGGLRNFYGKEVGLLYQLEIETLDGKTIKITSDKYWKSSFEGGVREADIYMGEVIDTRIDPEKILIWDTVRVVPFYLKNVISQEGLPVMRQEVMKPISTIRKGDKLILDYGQNLVGWIKLKIKGQYGDSLILKHGETLDQMGGLYMQNLRSAKQTCKYILNGNEQDIEPRFTYQGFRYVEVSGNLQNLDPNNVLAIVVHSSLPKSGYFNCSDSLINQLQRNIVWGLKGNFFDIPTDCPQRDERLGWTGDAQVFFNTAAFNRDVSVFFRKWLSDLRSDQASDGNVPVVIPVTTRGDIDGAAGWSDAASIIPVNHFLLYGDTSVIRDQYESMKAWVDFVSSESRHGLRIRTTHFGDWLFYTLNDDRFGEAAITDKALIAQVFYAASTRNLIWAAKVLNHHEDVLKYETLLKAIKNAFFDNFVTSSGRLVSDTQTAYVLALYFDILPDLYKGKAVSYLVQNIERYNYHLTTGFLGTPYINAVLSNYGRSDIAYKLLFQTSYPSWLYPITKGATTVWERWDGIKEDGSFQNPAMNSFNHYAYGAVGDWMYKTIAGIHIRLIIPPNTTAQVFLPLKQSEIDNLEESDTYTDLQKSIVIGEERIYELGSGVYTFQL